VCADKITVIYNGVDLKGIRNLTGKKARSELDLSQSQKYLLSVHNLVAKKRTESLLQSFKSIQSLFPDWKLLIAGDGPNKERLQSQIQKEDIRAELVGHVTDDVLYSLYNASSAFALNSINETLPMVYLESMAAGLPLCVSRSGHTNEIVSHGKQALLSDELDDEGFKQNVEKVLSDDNLRTQLGANARESANQYSWKAITDEVLSVYNEVLNHR